MSNSSLVSGLSEASGVKFTWSQGFQESPKIATKKTLKNLCSDVPSSPLKGPPSDALLLLELYRDAYLADSGGPAFEMAWEAVPCNS